VISQQVLENGEVSGYPTLDRAATKWVNAITAQNSAAGQTAESQVVAACKHLGIPLGAPIPTQ
jgi:hypothetical protein